MINSSECKEHGIKFLKYERVEYNYKGEMKKKVALVDKESTINETLSYRNFF